MVVVHVCMPVEIMVVHRLLSCLDEVLCERKRALLFALETRAGIVGCDQGAKCSCMWWMKNLSATTHAAHFTAQWPVGQIKITSLVLDYLVLDSPDSPVKKW